MPLRKPLMARPKAIIPALSKLSSKITFSKKAVKTFSMAVIKAAKTICMRFSSLRIILQQTKPVESV